MRFKSRVQIRFGDVDHARILYYPRFFHLFHQCFEDFFNQQLKVPYRHALDVDKVGFPAVHAEAEFISPLRFGDEVEVEMQIGQIGNKSAEFRYELRRPGDGELSARGRVTIATIDIDTIQGIPIPAKYRQLFEKFRGEA